MEEGESQKNISDIGENDSGNEEHSASENEDSEEESDDDGANEDQTEVVSDEDDEEADDDASDDTSDDDDIEAASTVTGDDDSIISDDENFEKEGLTVSGHNEPDASCSICFNEFIGQDLGSPENCSHTFCLDCIVEWSKNVNTCPIDRIEFHLIYLKQEIDGDIIRKIKVKVKKEVEEYVEEVTLCEVCRLGDREDRLLLCDSCDSGYHCECLDPPLETIPIEEWFCPPCARVINQRAAGSHSSHRLIARTSASEIVRSRIQNRRTGNSEDSSSEAVQQQRNVHASRRSPTKRRATKKKTKRRKAPRKSSKSKTKARTKASTTGKSKINKRTSKTLTKRKRKTKRRKTRKVKKKSRRSWLASMKLVAPSVKKRIADRLGICKPPPGCSMPYVKKSGGQHSGSVEQQLSLDMFGCRDQLLDFGENYIEDMSGSIPSTSKLRNLLCNSRTPTAVASASGINLLDNILENQNVLLQNSRNITIGKDGSLSVKEQTRAVEAKSETKSFKCEAKSETLSEQDTMATSPPSVAVEKEDDGPLMPLLKVECQEYDTVRLVHVKREKCSPSLDSLSLNAKRKFCDAESSSFHGGKKCLEPRVRFAEVETVFMLEDDACSKVHGHADEIDSFLPPVGGKDYALCPSFTGSEKQDIMPLEQHVDIKEERNDDLSLGDSSVATKSLKVEPSLSTSLYNTNNASINEDTKVYGVVGHKNNVINGQSQHLDSGFGNTSLSVKNAQEESLNDVINSADKSMCTLSFSHDTYNSGVSAEIKPSNNHSPRASRPVCAKTQERSRSLCGKLENKQKRHLPFLPNGLHRPFKIPKLAKSTGGSSVSNYSTGSFKISSKHLDSKVPTESETITEGNISTRPVLMNEAHQCDLKSKNVSQKHTLMEHKNNVDEAMDVDVPTSQKENVQSDAWMVNIGDNKLLHTSKQKKNELFLKSCKSGVNSKCSKLSVANPAIIGKEHATRNNPGSASGNFLCSQNLTGQINSPGSDLHCEDSDKKPSYQSVRNSSHAGSREKGEQKPLLNLDGVEQECNHRSADNLGSHGNTDSKTAETLGKVFSKQKLKEDIVAEIKKHLKDFYLTDLITKEEYKEIMRRSVPKVLKNCGNCIDSEKIRKLVVNYVHIIGNTQSE